jgi:hypothetical protein
MKKLKSLSIDKKFQAQWDLDTLKQAKEIEGNKARMTAVQNHAKEQVKMLGGIVSGKGIAPKKTISKKK